MEPTLAGLRAFVEVAERSSIRGAADALGYTPSAVSQRISSLETRLGVELFERLGNRIKLTATGVHLRQRALDVLAATEAFHIDAWAATDQTRTIAIGGFPSGMGLVVAPRVGELAEVGIDVRLTSLEDARGQRDLRLGALDLLLLQEYSVRVPRHDDFFYTELLTEPLVLVSSEPIESLAEAAELAWIVSSTETVCGQGVRHACRRYGFEPDIVADIEDFNLQLDFVAIGLGVAMMPESSARSAKAQGLSVQLLSDMSRKVLAAARVSSQADAMIAATLAVFAQPRDGR